MESIKERLAKWLFSAVSLYGLLSILIPRPAFGMGKNYSKALMPPVQTAEVREQSSAQIAAQANWRQRPRGPNRPSSNINLTPVSRVTTVFASTSDSDASSSQMTSFEALDKTRVDPAQLERISQIVPAVWENPSNTTRVLAQRGFLEDLNKSWENMLSRFEQLEGIEGSGEKTNLSPKAKSSGESFLNKIIFSVGDTFSKKKAFSEPEFFTQKILKDFLMEYPFIPDSRKLKTKVLKLVQETNIHYEAVYNQIEQSRNTLWSEGGSTKPNISIPENAISRFLEKATQLTDNTIRNVTNELTNFDNKFGKFLDLKTKKEEFFTIPELEEACELARLIPSECDKLDKDAQLRQFFIIRLQAKRGEITTKLKELEKVKDQLEKTSEISRRLNEIAKVRVKLLLTKTKPENQREDVGLLAQILTYFYPVTENKKIIGGFFPQLLDCQTKFYLESVQFSKIYQSICQDKSFFS